MSDFKYRPDVDGLRAIAVSLVVFFHAGLGFTGGFVGVDVFFVISGFLITGIVTKELEKGEFSLKKFMLRRIKRILPASVFMVFVVVVLGFLLLVPSDFYDLGKSVIAQQALSSNLYFSYKTDYFDGPSDLKPLLHTWSLAVEEQFYLLYPFFLMILRNTSYAFTRGVLVGSVFISLTLSILGTDLYPNAAFYLLPFRAWELLLGGLICYVKLPAMSRIMSDILGVLGLGMVFASAVLFDATTNFPGSAALVPCLGTMAVIMSSSVAPSFIGRLLSRKFAVATGLMSYSLYLWHWPVLAYSRYWFGTELPVEISVVGLSTSVLMAYASWRYIELPFRQSSVGGNFGKVMLGAAGSSCLVLVIALVPTLTTGAGFRISSDVRDFLPERLQSGYQTKNIELVVQGKLPELGIKQGEDSRVDFIVWGDSHASQVAPLFDVFGKKHGLKGQVACYPGLFPGFNAVPYYWRHEMSQKEDWKRAVLDHCRTEGIANVFLVARWAGYVKGTAGARGDDAVLVDSVYAGGAGGDPRQIFTTSLSETIRELTDLGIQVWIMGQVPRQADGNVEAVIRSVWWGSRKFPSGISRSDYESYQGDVAQLIASLPQKFIFVDPADSFFENGERSLICDEGGLYYVDRDHISSRGALMLLTPLLDPAFELMAKNRNDRGE